MKDQRILHLNLHREYFDLIERGLKKTEYRRCTRYWKKRLEGRKYDVIRFRNGYATKAPVMDVQYVTKGFRVVGGKKEYAIRLGKILKIKNYKRSKAR
ncbi:MAG: ASCH domain-containing protein [Actinobacteria bacterium]|nr:ASCH domain-containing protein [Actinomycetota bacterium]